MNIDLIVPKSLQSLSLETRYLALLKKTLLITNLVRPSTVDIMVTNNQTIRKYNKQFRNKDYPTDVLSFPFMNKDSIHLPSPIHLGQIVISYQQALKQAKTFGHSFERELSFLFVHGLLHLLGYNHETEQEERIMLALQKTILGKRISHE